MFFKKKKKADENPDSQNPEGTEGQDNPEGETENKKTPEPSSGSANLGAISADLERLKVQFDSFKEIRTAFSERFTRVSEQIGELRSMILEKDRDFQSLEAKALKTIDMVEAVQPEKLMVELRKQDGKVEALKANIESNEAIMARISDELKDIRNKMSMFKGVEQVIKMNEEVKDELVNIKKTEAVVSSHSDKAETIFMEMQKRFKELELFKNQLNENSMAMREAKNDLEALKIKTSQSVKKEELDELFNKLKKHIEGLEKLAEKSPLAKDLDALKNMLEDLKV